MVINMKEKDNKILSENTKNDKTPENKPSLSEMYYGSNTDTFAENDRIEREYLSALYGDDMDMLVKEIRMTRAQYIAEYNQIQENYKKEMEGTFKSLLFLTLLFSITLLISTVFLIISSRLGETGGSDEAVVASAFMILHRWVLIISAPVFIFFLLTLLKRIRDGQQSRKQAMDKLEKRKKECMAEGQYDVKS
jgi:uncharacterized membrane protein